MTFDLWLSFLVASSILAIAPGPDNLFVLLQSAMYGPKAGIMVTLGLCVGVLLQTFFAAIGVAAVVATSAVLLTIIKCLGATYLSYLAWGAWHAPVMQSNQFDNQVKPSVLTSFQLWRRGILMNITNPKVLIFFLAFFPQFLIPGSTEESVMLQMLEMGTTFLIVTLIVFSGIAWCAGALADRIRTERFQHYLNKISAVIFIALAISTLAFNVG